MPVYSLGVESELFNYEVNNLGNDFSILKNIYEGNHELSNLLKNSKRPLFLIGEELYTLEDYQNIVNHIYKIADKYDIVNESWNGYNLLVKNASTVGGLDIGFISKEINTLDILNKANKGVIRVLYLNQFDNIDNKKFENCFVIYQGHHGDKTAKIADLILPSACFTEKTATYVNLEGRCQSTKIAVQLPNLAKNDLDILNAIIENLGFAKKSNDEIKSELINTKSNFANYNEIVHRAVDFTIDQELQNIDSKNQDLNLDYCYYTTNSITRASATMNKCTEEL